MSAETEDPIPYPLPDNWDERGMAPVSTVAYAIMAITAAVLLLLGTARALRGDTGGTVLWAVVFGALMAWLSVSREGPPRRYRGPVLMNAVALTRADQQPPDSWVHFFRQQLASWGLGWALLIGGAGSGGLLVVAAIRAVESAGGGWLLLIVPLALGAALLVLCGVIALVAAYRSGSFGRIPIGISMGSSGFSRHYLDAIDVVPWEQVQRVVALAREEGSTEGARRVRIERHGSEPLELSVDRYTVPPWVLYAALRYWHEHPERREEVSTTVAQQRLERWCAMGSVRVPHQAAVRR
ncbi:hypothetical protein [Microbacterium xylanilyticum]